MVLGEKNVLKKTRNEAASTVLRRTLHSDDCPADGHTAYKMEKRELLKNQSVEEAKTIPEGRSTMYKQLAKRFPRLLRDRQDLVPAPEFTRTNNIRLLAAMKPWGMDGAFKVVPQWYQQLFTIHAFEADKLVPAVYCLCTGKDIGAYRFISQALISRTAALEVELNPGTIICDFEAALIPAILSYFPGCRAATSTSAKRYIVKSMSWD
ncbi:hypothetical protein T11_5141 [Trichinella zimbabwensis]|nr:hypothetical protein T11_5141 [Trichinella zimbabwensis]